jgi:hypothetical protein
MALRRLLGCLPVAALAVCAWTACSKDKGDATKGQATAADLNGLCDRMGKLCGDTDKHVEKIIEECKQAAKKQVEKGCTDKVMTVYDCYAKDLCGGTEKVWALDDLRVLADRHKKCVAERTASRDCFGQ